MSPIPEPLRHRHAAVTRHSILDAARRLFVEQGYADTSMRQLADEAGVAVQTIYTAVGSKPAVLMALVDEMDQQHVEPLVVQLMQAERPAEILALGARLLRSARAVGFDFIRVFQNAAIVDPELRPLWDQAYGRHRDGIARMCARVADTGALRPGLDLELATATALALTSNETYEELIHRRGWSDDEYERWVATALMWSLLGRAEDA